MHRVSGTLNCVILAGLGSQQKTSLEGFWESMGEKKDSLFHVVAVAVAWLIALCAIQSSSLVTMGDGLVVAADSSQLLTVAILALLLLVSVWLIDKQRHTV